MRYLSVCSGIEAATVAWHTLGWTPVAFSEIEPFPAAVLAHHYPDVPNYGDMTKHKEWPLEPGAIDLLVGGTPCQSFSVAGLRKGISDPRGGLMLTYLEIARRLRPRWVVWENVPGVLSSNGGRDFGSFLGAMGLLGYGVAYRVLDAQWCRTHGHPRAVPQRRRRVFVVGCLGAGAAAAQVLFERESVQRDSAKGRATRQGTAVDAEAGVARCVTTGEGKRQDYETCTIIPQPVPIQDGREIQKAQNGIGIGQQGDPAYTLDTTGTQAVGQPIPFTKSKRAQSVTDDETWVDGQVNPTLSLFDQGDTRATTVAVAFSPGNLARGAGASPNSEVAPTMKCSAGRGADDQRTCVAIGTDCYNGAITGDVAATMGTPGSSVNASGPTVMAFHPLQDPISSTDGSTHCMGTGGSQGHASIAVACPTLTAHNDPSRSPQSAEVTQQVAAVHATTMTVRRLTPRECERLQGFPDDWTLIPWRKKPAADCPDGPRYKALGNSMACNCMAWIGERIAAVEANNGADAAPPLPNRVDGRPRQRSSTNGGA